MGEDFSNFIANQWKTFYQVYAIPLLWDRLKDKRDRSILVNFVRACTLLTARIITVDQLEKAHRCLLETAKLVEVVYGTGLVTPNMHLSLHIAECCLDFGPTNSFWCFSFERHNGLLGKVVFC